MPEEEMAESIRVYVLNGNFLDNQDLYNFSITDNNQVRNITGDLNRFEYIRDNFLAE